MNHTTVYVIICVILASVELWNASACHTGRWHATPPIHTYIHTWTNTWAFLHDRTVCDDLAACTAQCTANAAGSPGTHSFVSCLTISRLERHPADSLVTFWMTARVNHALFSYRTFHMTTLRWSSTWMLPTVWWWRATCSRGQATPLRPGTGN